MSKSVVVGIGDTQAVANETARSAPDAQYERTALVEDDARVRKFESCSRRNHERTGPTQAGAMVSAHGANVNVAAEVEANLDDSLWTTYLNAQGPPPLAISTSAPFYLARAHSGAQRGSAER